MAAPAEFHMGRARCNGLKACRIGEAMRLTGSELMQLRHCNWWLQLAMGTRVLKEDTRGTAPRTFIELLGTPRRRNSGDGAWLARP